MMCFCCLHHHPTQLFKSYNLVFAKACTVRYNTELSYSSAYLWHNCLCEKALKKYHTPKKKKLCVCLDRGILLGSFLNVVITFKLQHPKTPSGGGSSIWLVTSGRGSFNSTCYSLLVLKPQILKENGVRFYFGSPA